MRDQPLSVYVNWSSYDELSDNVELTEAIAMRQFEELLRLRRQGVKLDCYLMDAFWYDAQSGYRAWRRPHFADDGQVWLNACEKHNVLAGLWIASKSLTNNMGVPPVWSDSVDPLRPSLCMFRGGFLADLMEVLAHWFDRGVRVFKFDFADLSAATAGARLTMMLSEIQQANGVALRSALKTFRQAHPAAILMGYNGLEEVNSQTHTDVPERKFIDTRWLECFDSVYCGDPRPADVPAANFWRSKDLYTDHMVRSYLSNGYPLPRIDNAGFMIGTTGTCYFRHAAGWRSMLLLSLARGGVISTYYGNLDLLNDADATWFASAQSLFSLIQNGGRVTSLGDLPGRGSWYGYFGEANSESPAALLTLVNASQEGIEIPIPPTWSAAPAAVLFHDAGFEPSMGNGVVHLGAEQMVVVGLGDRYAQGSSLGTESTTGFATVPENSAKLTSTWVEAGSKIIRTTLTAPTDGSLKVIVRQTDPKTGRAVRTTGGSPPNGKSLAEFFIFRVTQGGQDTPHTVHYDKAIWSGLSWAVTEIEVSAINSELPLDIIFESREELPVRLEGEVWHLRYGRPVI